MAEIMMLNNSTSTIQQNPSLSLGKQGEGKQKTLP